MASFYSDQTISEALCFFPVSLFKRNKLYGITLVKKYTKLCHWKQVKGDRQDMIVELKRNIDIFHVVPVDRISIQGETFRR